MYVLAVGSVLLFDSEIDLLHSITLSFQIGLSCSILRHSHHLFHHRLTRSESEKILVMHRHFQPMVDLFLLRIRLRHDWSNLHLYLDLGLVQNAVQSSSAYLIYLRPLISHF